MTGAARLNDVCTGHGCVVGSTKIKLMDGRSINIKDLVGQKNFYVYSLSQDNKNIVPGRVECVYSTGTKECLEIILDNGKSIIASTDHKFILRNGRRVKANKLKVGLSLMPLYSVIERTGFNAKGYESIQHPNGNWQPTHRMVYDWKYGSEFRNQKNKLNTAHHKDFDSLNNHPDNICAMNNHTHWIYHSKLSSKKLSELSLIGRHPWQQSHVIETNRNRMITNNPMSNPEISARKVQTEIDNNNGIHPITIRNYENNPMNSMNTRQKMVDTRRNHPLGYSHGKGTWTDKGRQEQSDWMKSNNPMHDKNASKRKNQSRKATDLGFDSWESLVLEVVNRSASSDLDTVLSDMYLITKYKNWKSEILDSWPTNHKIVSINYIGIQEVYNMSVAVTHNYALDIGIFINNCWPPRPNVGASPDVEVNGRGSHRVGDGWATHCCPFIPECHASVLAGGSPTVFVNGIPHGRIGDPVACGSSVASGSDNVILDELT